MSITVPNRRPAGSPTGGQFAPNRHAESDVDLSPRTPVLLDVEEMTRRRDKARVAHQAARRRLDDATLGVLVSTLTRSHPDARQVTARLAETDDGYLVLDARLRDEDDTQVSMRVDTEAKVLRLIGDLDIDGFSRRLCHSWRGPGTHAEIGSLADGEDSLTIDLRSAAAYLTNRPVGRS